MLLPATPHYRRRRGRTTRTPPAPVTPALALVGASYDSGQGSVTLAFNRPVNVAGYQDGQVKVNDGVTHLSEFNANGPGGLLDPNTVQFSLESDGPSTVSDVRLNATALNGIVAADDGEPWAGVSNLALPYP